MYSFKEITTTQVLEQAFKKRAAYFPGTTHPLVDIDEFDLYSRHYGLFLQHEAEEEFIGYLRITWEGPPVSLAGEINKVLTAYDIILPGKKYPTHAFSCYPCGIRNLIAHHILKDSHLPFVICEPDCLLIEAAHRSLRLMQFMLECAMVVICDTIAFPVPVGIVNVAEKHRVIYAKNLFTDLSSAYFPSEGKRYLMGISWEGVWQRLPDIEKRMHSFKKYNRLHLN